ncbi:hypothetical protein CYMTET_47394 [Cymbomonas tetramitiformis]|uniref:Uncharacterized protein n=1 Tax=Cymbomonas tetramitiformis TaxID=36881 RepID=A0AAE0BW95_9CHLO|nr:hypothetical protein CYMTET_47394 [Cymbomonas tetramitiformis]|eukprot:gene7394-8805_t
MEPHLSLHQAQMRRSSDLLECVSDASAKVVANHFALDLLVAHNAYNSSQAYFDAVLAILRFLYTDKRLMTTMEIVEKLACQSFLPHYAQVLQKWKETFKRYNEVDVCLSGSPNSFTASSQISNF